MNGSPDIPRTAARASTRRKPTKQVTKSTQPLMRTRRGTRGSAGSAGAGVISTFTTEGESDSESKSATEGESASDENTFECEEDYSDDDAKKVEEKDLEAPVLPIGFEKLENNHSDSESIVAEQSDIQVSIENQASTMKFIILKHWLMCM